MTPAEFIARLRTAAGKTELTHSDLGLWFGVPRQTVGVWITGDHSPLRTSREMEERLCLLERAETFPIPLTIRKRDRRDYIRTAYDALISEGDSAR